MRISATAHKNGSRNTERPNCIISPDIISEASPSTRMILPCVYWRNAIFAYYQSGIYGRVSRFDMGVKLYSPLAPITLEIGQPLPCSPPPTLTSTMPIPGATPEAVPETYDWFPISCSVSRFILTFSVLSMLLFLHEGQRIGLSVSDSLSGRVSSILQSLNPGSSSSCKSLDRMS